MRALCLVSTCTKRKTVAPGRTLHFGSLARGTVSAVARKWVGLIEEESRTMAVRELYAGAAWRWTLRCADTEQARATHLRIVSAGMGLLHSDDFVPSYEASFAPGPNQVGRRLTGSRTIAERHQEWWRVVNELRGSPQPLSQLSRHGRILVALGSDYLRACEPDLTSLAERAGPANLFVICCGISAVSSRDLGECLLPFGSGFADISPGPMSSVNIRAAAWLLETAIPSTGWDRAQITHYMSLTERATGRQVGSRGTRHTDRDILDWIRRQVHACPTATRSELLRRFRAEGRACEEQRFRRLASDAIASLRPDQGKMQI